MMILFVEEDAFFAEGVKRLFIAQGLEITHIAKSDEVVEIAAEEQPKIVLLDLRLSKFNGFEVLAALKEDARTANIPVMIWSQLASREDIDRCYELGACEYFLKSQHRAQEVANVLKKRLLPAEKQNGFTLVEALVVMAGLLGALTFAWFQVQRVLDIQRDDRHMVAVNAYASAIVASGQAHTIMQGCMDTPNASHKLADCQLCVDEACQNPVTAPWEQDAANADFLSKTLSTCTVASQEPCSVAIEQDGSQPFSSDAFKLRFFLYRDREGMQGGQTHTINAHGLVE